MLLKSYTKEISRPECNPGFESLHCIARLDQDVGEALPYLNAHLGGFEYHPDPPAVTFKVQGRLITVHHDRIALNALADEAQAEKILDWLRREIYFCLDHRTEIEPSYEGLSRPQLLQILKLLPRTNCGECGRTTCLVFAGLAAEGVLGPKDCPEIGAEESAGLSSYLQGFDWGPEGPG